MTNESNDASAGDFRPAEISELLGDGPTPGHHPEFWNRIDAELAPTMLLTTERRTDADIHDGAFGDTVVPLGAAPERAPDETRSGLRWILAAAAAFLAILGVSGYFLTNAATDESTVYAGDGERSGSDDYSSRPQPVDGDGNMIISPYVGLSGDRARYHDTLLFTVESELPLRTRATVLDVYNDSIWLSEGDFYPVGGGRPLDAMFRDSAAMVSSFQGQTRVTIVDPAAMAVWRPLPGHPNSVIPRDDGDLLFDRTNDVLIAGDRQGKSSNTYDVLFSIPSLGPDVPGGPILPTADELDGALRPFLELSDAARTELRDAVANLLVEGQNQTQAAQRLETRFRRIEVEAMARPVAGVAAITHMLEINAGQPELIAGGFAAAARSIDIPSRVVIGYDPGEMAEGRTDLWEVRGRDKTAWVELYIDGYWQTFSPVMNNRPEAPFVVGRPEANRDHWHAIFAIYDCANDTYLPPLMSTDDPVGIHSHQDGLIYIHPWSDESGGENARLGLFFETMGVEVRPDRIVADDFGFDVLADDSCPESSVVHLRKWRFDFEAQIAKPEIVTSNIGDVQFKNDREVYVLAVAPIDADLPPLPSYYFNELDKWSGVASADAPVPDAPFVEVPSVPLDLDDVDTAVAAPIATPDRLPPLGDGPHYYAIEAGESLGKIAEKFNVSVQDLRAANPNSASFQPGVLIIIPSQNESPAAE